MAKLTPLPAKLAGNDGDNKILFDKLCPLAVHQALGSFDNRKKELVKTELDRIQEATNLANASMSSMNLPAALEVTKGNEIPKSLREKSQAVINAGKVIFHFRICVDKTYLYLLMIILSGTPKFGSSCCKGLQLSQIEFKKLQI